MTTEKQLRYKIQESVGVDRERKFKVYIGETLVSDGFVIGTEKWKHIIDCASRQEAIDYVDEIRKGD